MEEEKQCVIGFKKPLVYTMMKPEGVIRSLKYDFDQHEPKKKEILNQLNENLLIIEKTNALRPKKRRCDYDSLINPFLKKVRITPT